jgi:hypothetical protein
MIRINLLPEEYRKKARTPVKMLAAVAASVAINASLLAWWCWMTFGVAAEINTELSVLQLEMDGLTPQVNYHDALQKEIAFHSAREKTLADVTKSRVLWTKVLDQLIDIVHSGGEGVRHFIWFDDVTAKVEEVKRGSRGARATSFGSLKAGGHSGSDAWNQVAAFLEDIEDPQLSSFHQIFYKPGSPEGTLNASKDDLIPAVNWSFPLSLELRSPEERAVAMAPETNK